MKRVRVYIADVDEIHIHRMARSLDAHGGFELVGFARDGAEAYSQVLAAKPDMLFTDMQLPVMDGIALLKALRNSGRPPVTIMCTRFYSEISIRAACRFGAQYFLYKPLDYESIPSLILDCWQGSRDAPAVGQTDAVCSVARLSAIRALLRELGISANRSGGVYMTDILAMSREDRSLHNLSKGLYADLATRMSTSVAAVERSLRAAIARAFESGALSPYFTSRPSNRDFLRFLLCQLDARLAEDPPSAAPRPRPRRNSNSGPFLY